MNSDSDAAGSINQSDNGFSFLNNNDIAQSSERSDRVLRASPIDRSMIKQAGAAVRTAWSSVLGEDSFQRNEAWNDAGGDSLLALHVVFVIERELMRKISYDMLSPTTRPSDLTAALVTVPAPPSVLIRGPTQPLVIVAPGITGDDPALAGFRAAFEDRVRFIVLRYPSPAELVRGGGSFMVIIESTLAQVISASVEGDIVHLLGYSYGALIVRQLALRLPEHQRSIGMLGMIDGFGIGWNTVPLMRPSLSPCRDVMRSLVCLGEGHWRGAVVSARQAIWSAIMVLLTLLPLRTLHLVPMLGRFASVSIAVELGRIVDRHLRARAIEGVLQASFGRRAVVFASSDYVLDVAADDQGELPDHVAIVRIGGSHASILELPLRSVLVEEVTREMTSAMRCPS